MFATLDGTVDQVLERRREARRREVRAICEQQARLAQRLTEIVREADDDGDWQSAGCSSSAQWLAQVCSSDHRTAERITRTSSALRSLPALDQALSTGALTLDQVAAATQFATPGTDAELARVAVGKAPSQIALAARTIVPPTVTTRLLPVIVTSPVELSWSYWVPTVVPLISIRRLEPTPITLTANPVGVLAMKLQRSSISAGR